MDINILIVTAISIGFIHTIIGPDHYLPFIVMGKSKPSRIIEIPVALFYP